MNEILENIRLSVSHYIGQPRTPEVVAAIQHTVSQQILRYPRISSSTASRLIVEIK